MGYSMFRRDVLGPRSSSTIEPYDPLPHVTPHCVTPDTNSSAIECSQPATACPSTRICVWHTRVDAIEYGHIAMNCNTRITMVLSIVNTSIAIPVACYNTLCTRVFNIATGVWMDIVHEHRVHPWTRTR